MKLSSKHQMLAALLSAAVFAATGTSHGEESAKPGRGPVDVLELKAVPEGHYLLTLEMRALDSKTQRVNLEVKGNAAQCVNSSDPRLKSLKGQFEPLGNGVFLVTLRSPVHTATQFWAFRKDGSASVKEVPNRGESQWAIPVRDDTIEAANLP